MDIRHVPSKTYFCAEKELLLTEVPSFSEEVLESLYNQAQTTGLTISGPTEYVYLNSSTDPAQPVHLIIAIPVAESKPIASDYFFWQATTFTCISTDYEGSMVGIGEAWSVFVQRVLEHGYILGNQGREVYREWVSFESEDNITELQVGVVGRRLL